MNVRRLIVALVLSQSLSGSAAGVAAQGLALAQVPQGRGGRGAPVLAPGMVPPGMLAPAAGPVVTGAPYSADVTTSVVQTLGDGTRIERQSTARVYRDGTGRTRREQTIMGLDLLNPATQPQTILTFDATPGDPQPWILDPVARSARRSPGITAYFAGQPLAIVRIPDGRVERLGAAAEALRSRTRELERASNLLALDGLLSPAPGIPGDVKPTEESLGTRDVEGVKATGRRTTAIIPLGRIGNTQPITIVDERWESPELGILVYSRFSDPRSGVVEYKLTNIRRGEPAADLFRVPADYSVVDAAWQPGVRIGGGGARGAGGAGRGARGN